MPPRPTVTVQWVWRRLRESLALEALTELPEQDIPLAAPDVHRPGMALMGFMDNFLPGRLQVLGESEIAYIAGLDEDDQDDALGRLERLSAPAVYVSRNQCVPAPFLRAAERRQIPVFRTGLATEDFIRKLGDHLNEAFAPVDEVHASLVDVYGVGMLFTGKSGIGKSETALDLVERGHRLVADDIVEVRRMGEDILVGRFRDVLQHSVEIRGVGVIDVQAVFGIRGIRMQKRIEVEVNLQRWRDDVDYERTGLDRRYSELLGVRIPRIEVPIFPGKNITVIAEVIALDFMLKIYGIDAAQDLNRRIMDTLRRGDELRGYLRQDRE
ncbi:MAG TPA: HPr(Ser) kinase/phosphatase [Candidatus Krumholzibacteria bacterium]|nr:HPr(Ser) kinase/phosphatase [Candidatus Krumholzibacteria bacterium]HRX50373.1 HPr(Ser) kinase/phosphatase [Candidatus Krumholzibacteria bacterium]